MANQQTLATSQTTTFYYKDGDHSLYVYEEGTKELTFNERNIVIKSSDFARTCLKVFVFKDKGTISVSALATFLHNNPDFADRAHWTCNRPDSESLFLEAIESSGNWLCRKQDEFIENDNSVPFSSARETLPIDQDPQFVLITPRHRR